MSLNRNKENSGRRRTAHSKDDIELVRNMLEKNPNLTLKIWQEYWIKIYRVSSPQVLVKTAVLQIWSKFTGKHPCRSVISINLTFKRPVWQNGWVFDYKLSGCGFDSHYSQ